MIKCFEGLKKFRMRTQIILFQIIILAVVLGLANLGILVQKRIFYYTSANSSEKIIYNTDIKLIKQTAQLISKYIQLKHYGSILLLNHLASFVYLYNSQGEHQNHYDIDPCIPVENFVPRSQLQYIQKFCYSIDRRKDKITRPEGNKNQEYLDNTIKQLNNFGLMLNIYHPNFLQIVDIFDINYDFFYPFGAIQQDYNPKIRPWYLNHLEKMKNNPSQLYYFSDVYKLQIANGYYQFSITQSIFNSKNEFFAIAKAQLNITDGNFLQIHHNSLLINYFGQVFYNGLNQGQKQFDSFYIYNENITGFNKTDWQQIEDYAQSNNQQIDNKEQILILFDKLNQQFVHVYSQKFKEENFTLIIYTNSTSIKILEEKYQTIEEEFFVSTYFAFLELIISGLFLGLVGIICVKVICQPLININAQITQHVLTIGNNTNQEIFKMFKQKQANKQNLFTALFNTLENYQAILEQNQNKKSLLCRCYENMKFNRQSENLKLTQIQHQFQLLQTRLAITPQNLVAQVNSWVKEQFNQNE